MTTEQRQQAISEFKQIYLDEFGIKLSDQEASIKALSMLQLFEVLTDQEGKIVL